MIDSGGNQGRLGNGCVCDSGCDSCNRLAIEVENMREGLANMELLQKTLNQTRRERDDAEELLVLRTADCARLAEAWEAMREALQQAPIPSAVTTKYVRKETDISTLNAYERWFHVRCAALALIDRVAGGGK